MALPAVVSAVSDQMQMSREYALLGNYDAALVYFDGVIAQVHGYLSTLHDPHVRSQWARAKEELVAERQLVKDLSAELERFREQPGARRSEALAGLPSAVSTPADDFDPDVWAAPSSRDEPAYAPRRPLVRRVSAGGGGGGGGDGLPGLSLIHI